jgi:hypothetical protein
LLDQNNQISVERRAPDPEEVRALLVRMLGAEPLRSSPQLSSFLRYIVGETLEGRGQDLKGYSIATLALGRPDTFDPQLDPIVRVQAGRLRQAMAEYHAAHATEDLAIVLDKGVYVPRFEVRSREPAGGNIPAVPVLGEQPTSSVQKPLGEAEPTSDRQSLVPPSSGFWRSIASVLAVAVLSLVGAIFWFARQDQTKAPTVARANIERLLPSMIVEAGAGEPSEVQELVHRTRDAIARFDDIIVVHDIMDMVSTLPRTASPRPGSALTLRIAALSATERTQRFSARLIDQADQSLVWSREFDPIAVGPNGDAARTRVVRSIATRIAQPYGIIHAHVRNKVGVDARRDDPYGCLIAGFDYWRVNDAATHKTVRNCLIDKITSQDRVAGLHAQLAYLHLEEFRQGYNKLPGNPLDRALESAQRAIALAPASARSHQALLAVHFARREMDSAWRAAEEAMALNPYDTEIQADVGARHVQSGKYETGLSMLTEALQLNPAPPTWAVTFRALALYLLGRLEQSGPLASALKGSEYAPAMMAMVMMARQYMNEALGKQSLADMRRVHPGIVDDPTAYLQRLNFDDQTLARVVRDFSVSRDWASGLR